MSHNILLQFWLFAFLHTANVSKWNFWLAKLLFETILWRENFWACSRNLLAGKGFIESVESEPLCTQSGHVYVHAWLLSQACLMMLQAPVHLLWQVWPSCCLLMGQRSRPYLLKGAKLVSNRGSGGSWHRASFRSAPQATNAAVIVHFSPHRLSVNSKQVVRTSLGVLL